MTDHKHMGVDVNKNEQKVKKEFAPPRHWIGVEELSPDYWTSSESTERRGQEFFEKPVEWLENVDKSTNGGMVRREFLTLMGASMAMASFGCARRPVNKIIPYVVKPEEITPGVAEYYATTCTQCSAACGAIAKTREGRPIKLEGNPDHPSNRGALCARGQASILSLYDQDRLPSPLIRSRDSGGRKDSNWETVDRAIQGKLIEIQRQGKRIRVLSGVLTSPSTKRLISEFLGAFKDGAHIQYDALEPEEIFLANDLSYGTKLTPAYRFGEAEVVLSLGADFLGTWLSPVEFAKDWSTKRKLDSSRHAQAEMSKLYCVESAFTVTGANADERIPVRPGDELKLALAIAHELLIVRKRAVSSELLGQTEVQKVLQPHSPEAVAVDLALPGGVAKIREIAEALWEARGRSLVVAGSPHSRTAESVGLQVAVNLLNSVLGNDGKTVDFSSANPIEGRRGYAEFAKLIEEMKAGQVDALLVHRCNPAYTLPAESGFRDAVKKVPLVLVFSTHDDETARLADYVLAESHGLESWGDAYASAKVFSIQQPLISPIHSTRSFEDALLAWSKNAPLKAQGLLAQVTGAANPTWHDYLRENWRQTVYPKYGGAKAFDRFWEETLKNGFTPAAIGKSGGSVRKFRTAALIAVPGTLRAAPAISLSLYANVALYDGSGANNPWLQELPNPISSVTWDNYLSMSPELAMKLGLVEHDVVEMSREGRVVRVPVHIQPGLHPAVVTGALGYGRKAVGRIGDGTGVDLYPWVAITSGSLSYAGMPVQLKKTGQVYRLAMTQWHTVSEDRPIVNDISMDEFKKNPAAANHTDPHLRMDKVPSIWPAHDYKGQRWGMAIDFNSCIGCGACVVACQAENNIPVVGRDNVRRGRNMHWLRIDRYYSGAASKPEVLFQPMLCQHCENAPCETVCPVIATTHSDDGLNLQVYNRCVGTRYCQNNCPYKVRRFNFFDHWKSYEGTMNLAWNPDVTVRTRGVMEKCTFCTQRIKSARNDIKSSAGPGNDIPSDKAVIPDGGVLTACQQTCPTGAIVFGDINDPKSRVSRLRADQRAFRALETQNTKPAISYLTKVRNRVSEKEGNAHGHE